MTIKLEAGTLTLLNNSTELNSLASNARVLINTAFDNSNSANLHLAALFELSVTWASNPTAGGKIPLYLIPCLDGTNYAYNVTGSDPAPELCVGYFTVAAATARQVMVLAVNLGLLPPVLFKAYIRNGSSQAMPASGSTLKILPYRLQ
jgi:hypothetical protein